MPWFSKWCFSCVAARFGLHLCILEGVLIVHMCTLVCTVDFSCLCGNESVHQVEQRLCEYLGRLGCSFMRVSTKYPFELLALMEKGHYSKFV